MHLSNKRFILALLLISSTTQKCAALAAVPQRFFVGGLGYVGSRLVVRLRQEFPDCEIAGCVRSQTRKQQSLNTVSNNGVRVHVLDLDDEYRGLDEEGVKDLLQATHIVQTVAPIADFDRDPLLSLHGDILQESNDLQWVGYLSSTGVYGDHEGEWVDETSQLNCQDVKSLARVQAEMEWRQLEESRREIEHKTRVDCFRCGGIYGPGRGPLFSSSLKSTPPEEATPTTTTPKYVNRILVDDICGAIVAAVNANIFDPKMKSTSGGKIYNLVDDDPAPRRDVVAEARKLVSPSTKDASEGDASTSTTTSSRRRPSTRNTGNKRCRNQLLKDDYEWKLIAPTYRQGLAHLWEQQKIQL